MARQKKKKRKKKRETLTKNLDKLADNNGKLGRPLRFEEVRDTAGRVETRRMDVPEFGEDAEDVPYIIVHGMTVAERMILSSALFGDPDDQRAAMCIVAALTTRDDRGQLVFGTTKAEAIANVEALPEKYLAVIARISQASIALTALAQVEDEATGQSKFVLDTDANVAEAEKN